MPQEVSGVLSRLAIHGRWGRATLTTSDGKRLQVVGEALVGLVEEGSYRLVGDQKLHPKFGAQFEVSLAQVDVPGGAGIIKYLQKHFANCGEKTAAAILDWYSKEGGRGLEGLRSALALRPWEIEACPALGTRRIAYLDESGASLEGRVHRRLSAELVAAKVPDQLLKKVAQWLLESLEGQDKTIEGCWERFRSDPFAAVPEVEGYGYQTADAIARCLSLDSAAPCRLAAALEHAVKTTCDRGGDVYLTREQAASALHQLDEAFDLDVCLDAMGSFGGRVVQVEDRIYESGMERTERFVADALGQLLQRSMPLWCGSEDELDRRIERLELAKSDVFRLDASQRSALKGILLSNCRIHTLTAPPGHGKTSVMEMLAGLLTDVMFSAPTGMAAKVLSGAIVRHGVTAQTTHAMLEANGETFKRNRKNQLVANLLVLDEGGMQDLITFSACLEAMGPSTHLLVVGDVDQLEAVGRGAPLEDLMKIPNVDKHELTVPHRSSGGVLQLLDAVRTGEMPEQPPGEEVHYVFFEGGSSFGFDEMVALWAEAVNRRGLTDVGLMFAHRRGSATEQGWNSTYANRAIGDLVNPVDDMNVIPGTRLRLADRVIIKRNISFAVPGGVLDGDRQKPVVNGDTGHLVGFSLFQNGNLRDVSISLDEGRIVRLTTEQFKAVEPAYARTVHSAQGAEFAEVIFVAPDRSGGFANRRILYTAVSRTKGPLWLVGSYEAFKDMAARKPRARNSHVSQRVAKNNA